MPSSAQARGAPALAIALGRKGTHTSPTLGERTRGRARASPERRINERFLPGFDSAGSRFEATNDLSARARRRRDRGQRHALAALSRAVRTNGAVASPGDTVRQLHKGTRERNSAAHDRGDRRRAAGAQIHSPGGSTERPVVRQRGGARRSDGRDRRLVDGEVARAVQQAFNDSRFRVYTNDDVIGVELGGALKNIIAIAAGVCDGLGLGHNSVAALITRGLAEVARLVVACGGRLDTMAGLAGLGDLVLTCTGDLSRNRSVGVELGKGRKLPDIIAGMHGAVAEGVFTTKAAVGLARKKNVEMPITEQMFAILEHGKSPQQAIEELMTRAARVGDLKPQKRAGLLPKPAEPAIYRAVIAALPPGYGHRQAIQSSF